MTREGYAAGTAMTNGYPAEADMIAWFYERGLELPTDNNPESLLEFLRFIWGILNAVDWAAALGVYCPLPTKFNVRGGKYSYDGTAKTYTPGSDIDPTNNDTTYIWMKPDNTIGYGIDGNGWPGTAHIKLAEIDVDSDGVITDVRDLRGQSFLSYVPPA